MGVISFVSHFLLMERKTNGVLVGFNLAMVTFLGRPSTSY